jgi:hypothetical protein
LQVDKPINEPCNHALTARRCARPFYTNIGGLPLRLNWKEAGVENIGFLCGCVHCVWLHVPCDGR